MFVVLFVGQTYTNCALAPYCKRQVFYSVVTNSRDWPKQNSLEYTVLQRRKTHRYKEKAKMAGLAFLLQG